MNSQRQIVITGLSSDLGGVLARELAKDSGTQIVGTMRRKKRVSDRYSSNVHLIADCDLTRPDCCEEVAKAVAKRFKGPFGVVHSVGDFWDHVPFLEFGPTQASRMFESHVATLYNSLQALIPIMRKKGGGSWVSFSCNSVRYNYPYMASFTAAKSAVDSLMRSSANEFSGDGLRFNSLVLASVKTQKVHRSKPCGDFAHFIPPEDIVPIVRFLLSRDAYLINGSAINLFRHSAAFYHTGYFERIAK